MKHEWRKHEKELYLPKVIPELVKIPKQKFFIIKGKGNPNDEDFSERIGVLYTMSYAVRMMPKNGFTPDGYFEYTVYPLEGLWNLTEEGKKADALNKDELLYTIMIRQPEFVNENVAEKALAIARKKKPHPLLDEIVFDELEDGLSIQMLHKGSYDNEPENFAKMKEFMENSCLQRKSMIHREIYLSDARKVGKDKLRTVLRYMVK
ncbi:hypothetical protein HBE96_08600 [Clostridium sp. P21]|uniref:GyrI-like small molecule binding domain-containing protein n=1 Tax=Clostridium muellerianum TaxID=2716538 RepID=A0A7Y0EFX0_9CLOT|nr:GyrI-like domain-containing protein [Clostridium muellerianum]NMM62754.1 hypothetical protein [Clostridium muellerianum]